MEEKGLDIDDLWKPSLSRGITIKSIKPTEMEIDEDSVFYNKYIQTYSVYR